MSKIFASTILLFSFFIQVMNLKLKQDSEDTHSSMEYTVLQEIIVLRDFCCFMGLATITNISLISSILICWLLTQILIMWAFLFTNIVSTSSEYTVELPGIPYHLLNSLGIPSQHQPLVSFIWVALSILIVLFCIDPKSKIFRRDSNNNLESFNTEQVDNPPSYAEAMVLYSLKDEETPENNAVTSV